jgi:hypothetical protein
MGIAVRRCGVADSSPVAWATGLSGIEGGADCPTAITPMTCHDENASCRRTNYVQVDKMEINTPQAHVSRPQVSPDRDGVSDRRFFHFLHEKRAGSSETWIIPFKLLKKNSLASEHPLHKPSTILYIPSTFWPLPKVYG